MASIFSKIIQGEIPSYKVYEDERFYAFLDIFPLREGHTLLVPKQETDYLFDLPDDLLGEMNIVAKRIAKGIEQVVECERIGMAVIGLEVPHAHIHLVPINGVHDIDFAQPKLELSEEEFQAIAKRISEAI